MRNIYLLKDLSRRSGYSTHTLKYYLRLGLFEEIGRSPETNFRYFDDSTLKKLEKIKILRDKNFSLEEISKGLGKSILLRATNGMENAAKPLNRFIAKAKRNK